MGLEFLKSRDAAVVLTQRALEFRGQCLEILIGGQILIQEICQAQITERSMFQSDPPPPSVFPSGRDAMQEPYAKRLGSWAAVFRSK